MEAFSGVQESKGLENTVIVGAGQSGLACGYFLKQRGVDFLILDEMPRIGTSWRTRWDSLRLFSPSQFDGLPGQPFPKPDNYFPTKDDMAGYLEGYAEKFGLPIRHNVKVDRLQRADSNYRLSAGPHSIFARNVIVATGPFRSPKMPSFAKDLSTAISQLHSSAYCNPAQLQARKILVVGAANSGAEIALELAASGRSVWLAGRDVGILPITTQLGRAFGGRASWLLMNRILNVRTPIGRRARMQVISHGLPLGRARRQQVKQAGVELVGRVTGVQAGKPHLENGQLLEPDCVIWATGFRPDYSWIDLPLFDERGYPRHDRGVVAGQPGLYFIGLPFQSAFSSALVGGVGGDAAYITRQIAN